MPHNYIEEFRKCKTCQNAARLGAGVAFLEHLKRDHHMDDERAMAVVTWIFDKIARVRGWLTEPM
jgi:hypothetical protein